MGGNTKGSRRRQLIQQFEDDTRFAVLVVSSVGVAGLNLQCANILVVMVSTSFTL